MAYILDPEQGALLSAEIKRLQDKVVLEKVEALYNAVKTYGEENALVRQVQEKFLKFQDHYNNIFVDAITKVKEHYEEYTNLAEHNAKQVVDTNVTAAAMGTVAPNNYDAAKNL